MPSGAASSVSPASNAFKSRSAAGSAALYVAGTGCACAARLSSVATIQAGVRMAEERTGAVGGRASFPLAPGPPERRACVRAATGRDPMSSGLLTLAGAVALFAGLFAGRRALGRRPAAAAQALARDLAGVERAFAFYLAARAA